MDYLKFDESTEACAIDLDTLNRTLKMEDAGGGLPRSAPIEHSNLLIDLIDLAKKHAKGFFPVLQPIIINQKNCRRIKWRKDQGDCPVENYQVERLVAKILFKPENNGPLFVGQEDAEGHMAAAVSYNERGIQLAFGNNVSICQNLNIWGENIISTYGSGKRKSDFDTALDIYEKWLQDYEEHKETAIEAVTSLKNIVIEEPARLRIFGKLYEQAVMRNNREASAEAPLNQTECTKMIRAGLEYRMGKTTMFDKTITAWDLTNWCTNVIKPETSDMVHLLTRNADINNFILLETRY